MKRIIPGVFLILLLIPASPGFAQEYVDTPPTITVSLPNESPYVYKDSEGYAVVVGEVENNNALTSVTNVQLQVRFYDDLDPNPIEVVDGTTILEVIPEDGKSPFSIRSMTANPNITEASVSLLGFDSSASKTKGLTVSSSEISRGTELHLSGVVQNGGAPTLDTRVHLAFYDQFVPPRILEVYTVEIGTMEPNTEAEFELDKSVDARVAGFLLFSESDIFYSDFVDVKVPPPQPLTTLVKISSVSVEDTMGNKLSEIPLGSIVNIKSNARIQLAEGHASTETAYRYYVQVKESGASPAVEFIEKFDGRFIGTGNETPTIDWLPEKAGLFFIETFVWDKNNIPIAEPGPVALIFVR